MKISKEFYIDRDTIDVINRDLYENIVISRKESTAKLYKITISYELDREITINESDLENAFKDISISGHSLIDLGVMDKVKKKLFGGSENE